LGKPSLEGLEMVVGSLGQAVLSGVPCGFGSLG